MGSQSIILAAVFACSLLMGLPVAYAEQQERRPCVGFNTETGSWGQSWISLRGALDNPGTKQEFFCPNSSGFYAVDDPGEDLVTDGIPVIGVCCPLPRQDILSEEHSLVKERCPEDAIVTGSVVHFREGQFDLRMRCTKIDGERYQLSSATPGAYWGIGLNMNTFLEQHKVKKSDIPSALRHAVGRLAAFLWDDDGCVAWPPGGLLVGATGRLCRSFLFKDLLTHDGQRVEMFPDCAVVSDVFDPNAYCLDRSGKRIR